jgi:sulfotransferase family protein
MWSGPRNISTAMMRSWGNRDDCVVVDEPLYAHFLAFTRKPHPGYDEVIAAGQTDWRTIAAQLTGPIPDGKRIYFQKHMTHHLLPGMELEWLGGLTNCFLIRNPREVLASYMKVIEAPELEDLGFVQQIEIFEWVRKTTGSIPPVLDAADILRNPRHMLGTLCEALGVEFQEAMLAWPPGPRSTDGVWAKYWYAEVEKSTGFRPYHARQIDLPERLEALYAECLEDYEILYARRLH